ncbi:MAG: citrate synthase/methylcitrate synthase [Thermoprotei archaeon]
MMSPENSVVLHKGLDNVYVAESSICYIDGENSKLFYRGYSVEELAQSSTFEEVAFLLIYGWLPKKEELEGFVRSLKESYFPPQEVLTWLKTLGAKAHPMDVLRTSISMLSLYDDQGADNSLEANRLRGLRVIGVTPTIIASFARIRRGLNPVEPKTDLPIASNFLYMLRGSEPDSFDASVMDKAMILHAEHEMNASTFSCIVTASTLSDMYSAITAGIATLKGPLHGGANEAALKYIQSVGSPEKATEAVEKTLNAKQRIMGFGHRVYKNYDPRYLILKPLAKQLGERKGTLNLYLTAEAVEHAAIERLSQHKLFPNVDFYSGLVFNALGIDTDLFTPIFAMSRNAGWVAHVLEYLADNRLIRPKAYYTGKLNKPYVEIERRGGTIEG